MGRYEVTIKFADGRARKIQSKNYLLKPDSSYYTPQCTSVKTDFTNAARKCLVSSTTLRGRTVTCGLLCAWKKKGDRDARTMAWQESKALLSWALGITG